MKKLLTGIVIVVIIFAGTRFGIQAIHSLERDKNVLPAVTVNNESDKAEPEKKPAPGMPKTLKIPKINVETDVESVGLDSKKRMDVPKDSDNVAWYNLGPRPGMSGSSVLAGHKDESDGSPSVFWALTKLNAGDKIIVTDENGNDHTYTVTDQKEYPDANFPIQTVFNPEGKAMLNLITCAGEWNATARNYSQRIVVFSELDE